jgi:3-deoxy-D-manno-octulosonic-acid transferase
MVPGSECAISYVFVDSLAFNWAYPHLCPASMPSSDLRSFLLDLGYGAGLKERLGDIPIREGNRPCLWIHAASVGEVQAARPLVAECRRRFPDLDISVSTQTKTGQEMARSALPDCISFYYPLDLSC